MAGLFKLFSPLNIFSVVNTNSQSWFRELNEIITLEDEMT